MEATVFNPAQQQLLNMMSYVKSDSTLKQLNQVISKYFANVAQNEVDKLWKSGALTEEKVNGFRTLHERTAYK
ncbi:MAG: dephospho-CoA kinase [Paludibacteraceae bacterium]|nr:dephospho-CoA kinase [Paludibacteraceae bacterium]